MTNTLKLKWVKIPEKFPKVQIDEEFLQNVESLAGKCFENPRYQEVYRLHNEWYNHVNNILKRIADFCSESSLDRNLNGHELTIIIAAAILHDIGKSLPYLHPLIDDKKIFDNDFVLKKLEDAHQVISFVVLKKLVNKMRLKNIIRENKKQKAHFSQMQALLKDFSNKIEKPENSDWKKYLQCAAWMALRHKQVKDKHLHIFKDDLKKYFNQAPGVDDETYEKEALDFFNGKEGKDNPEIKDVNKFLEANQDTDGPEKFKVLSALLQLGDKLDITRTRIRKERLYLEVLLDDLEKKTFRQEINIQKQYIIGPQSLIRWFQYYYVNKIEIKKILNGNKEIGLDITIYYTYPECLRDDFLFIRLQLEKDFEDLGILSTLEGTLQKIKRDEDYRISIYRSENRKDDNVKPWRIIGLQRRSERLVYCMEKVCKSVGSNPNDEEYIKKKLQGCLELTDVKVADIFSCMKRQNGNPTPEKCALFKRVEKIFQKNDGKASHPDWDNISIKLSENVRYLFCHDDRNGVTDNINKYRNRLTNKDKDYIVMLSLSRQAKEGVKQWKTDAEEDRKKLPVGTIFYPPKNSPQFNSDSNTRRIPVSLDIAYLLNLFRHLQGESLTVDDIVAISGLDRGRILKYCGWLEHEQYLLLDDKEETYKINLDPAKYNIVEKVLKEFDFHRSEMVSKIRDIDRFGKPLALYSDLPQKSLKTRIVKLDSIFAPFNKDKEMEGLPLRKSILLVGPPGSGKTTLALDIVRQVRLQRLPEEIALYLTFAGDIQRLTDDFDSLGWEYQDIAACVRSLSTLQGKTYLNDPDKFFKHLLNILDEFSPDLVAIDNLGYFLRLVPPEFCREIFNRLIKVLTVRGITSILIGDDIPNGIGFECFDTDGVICLHYKDGKRELEITKMRGREFAGGRHPFKIKNLSEKLKNLSKEDKRKLEKRDDPIIEIFPNIQMHLEVTQRKEDKKRKDKTGEPLKSGIKGLDELLPIYSEKEEKKYGFEQGEIILVLGSPGAGKTLSGLHFLAEGFFNKDIEKQEKVLWVSFESDLDGLQLATRSFSDKAGVKNLVIKMEKNKDEMFRFFPPAQLDPNELVNFLLDACVEKKLDRLVLDSVNDIEQAFDLDMAFKSFMTSLVQLLRENGVTVMFLYRTRSFFGKSEDIGRTLTSVVDTIICLKVLEIQNAVQKGLFLLKVRGREHKSRLLSINFKDDEGMSVLDSGWTMSGLISGEAGEIKEPRVSVKLFFENRNEFLINALIVSEYNRRFKGGQTTFVHVRKPQIYSEFWSFKGSSGAGHSNVRVVSLCDYWAAHFQRQEKLYDLVEYVSAAAYQLVHREEFWRRCASYSFKKNAFEIFSIPNYVDIGVLAFHEDLIKFKNFWKAVKLKVPQSIEEAREELTELTWNKLDATKTGNSDITDLVMDLKKSASPRYLFAMPTLESKASFVSFFLELYWSFGGVIFDLRSLFNKYTDYCFKNKDTNKKGKEFFNSPQIQLSNDLQFVAEILMLIPERILNNVIRCMNATSPNFIGDICRHGEVLLEQLLRDKEPSHGEKKSLRQIEKKSAITDIDKPLESFRKILPENNQNNLINNFINNLMIGINNDIIWKDIAGVSTDFYSALDIVKSTVKEILKENIKVEESKKSNEKLLVILFFVVSRIITNRERYQKLLEWYYKPKKEEENDKGKDKVNDKEKEEEKRKKNEFLSEIIIIGPTHEDDKNNDARKAAAETFEFLFQLVNSGIAPNPHRGDFTDQAYLARKWSGDVAPRPKLPPSKDLISDLDLNMPPDAYEYKKDDIEKTNYRIAPLPLYEKKVIYKDESGNDKEKSVNSSCAVMGLWSLGIIKPALSPEIGWIFIDALTENKFIELRAKRGLGLPAKAPAYQRESIRKAHPEIYGFPNEKGILKGGIVQYYDLATQDKAKEESPGNDPQNIVHRRTRERVSIPYYYQIEEFLIKELSRFFEPSFFAILEKKEKRINEIDIPIEEKQKLIKEKDELIGTVLQRIHNRIKNFLIKEFELADEPSPAESQQNKKTLDQGAVEKEERK